MTGLLVVLCACEAILIAFFVGLWRGEREERQFWFDSSERAWDQLLKVTSEDEDATT